MPTNRTLRIALVGCGQIADAHLGELRKISSADVVATCDSYRDLAEQAARGRVGHVQTLARAGDPHVAQAPLLLEILGSGPDLCVLFVSTPHVPVVEDIVEVTRAVLAPKVLLGASAMGVLGGSLELEQVPAISVWAATLPDTTVRPVTPLAVNDQFAWGGAEPAPDATVLLLADPFSFPVEAFLGWAQQRSPRVAVIGGLASAATSPGRNRLVLDGSISAAGAVGVVLSGARPTLVVSQGCRPIGSPFTVTRVDGNLLVELGGRSALQRLVATLESLDESDRALAAAGLHCGIAIDERNVEYAQGDFLIRPVLGVDRSTGAVAVGHVVPVGATVQFQVHDGDGAHTDLVAHLANLEPDSAPVGALVFACNGRGTALFGQPHHDATLVQDVLGPLALAGMFCAGELGPVNLVNRLHAFTASIALF